MSDAIGLIEGAMRADADALRVIGQNIANAEVTAYRRQISVTRTGFDEVVDAQAAGMPMAPEVDVVSDSRAGTLRATGEPLNLAIEGSGFFALQGPAGTLLTRRGDLHVSPEGLLVAASGEVVLGTDGPIHLGTTTPQVKADGTILEGADAIAQLRIVHVADERQLQSLGNGLFSVTDNAAILEDAGSSVRQGYLESSNVNPTGEMVLLMETLRHFEAAQRYVHGYDQMLEKAISELGKVG